MNIKVKAALEVAVGIISMMAIVVAVRLILNSLAETYGTDTVVHGFVFVFVSTVACVAVSLLYDYRVAQLRYEQKLTEMVNK